MAEGMGGMMSVVREITDAVVEAVGKVGFLIIIAIGVYALLTMASGVRGFVRMFLVAYRIRRSPWVSTIRRDSGCSTCSDCGSFHFTSETDASLTYGQVLTAFALIKEHYPTATLYTEPHAVTAKALCFQPKDAPKQKHVLVVVKDFEEDILTQ